MPTDTARHPSETVRRLGTTLLLPALLFAAVAAEAASPLRDVRIVVDISAGTPPADPDHPRIPALRLLPGLVPADAHAGIWTFGRYVNMLVAHGPVDDAWRIAARAAIHETRLIALYRNIEGALETATWNWHAPDDGAERHLILFTDGMIALPGGATENADSRSRITGTLLPRLRTAGVRVHAITLSDAADEALLHQLTAATGGILEKIHEPAELERILARLFTPFAESEGLPPRDQGFPVTEGAGEPTIDVMTPPAVVDGTAEADGRDVPAMIRPDDHAPARKTNWLLVFSAVLAVDLVLIALLWLAWRRWIEPRPAYAAVAEAGETTAGAAATSAAMPPTVEASVNDIVPEEIVTAADTTPAAPAADEAAFVSAPAPEPGPPSEEIVIDSADFDDIELDFSDDDRKLNSA